MAGTLLLYACHSGRKVTPARAFDSDSPLDIEFAMVEAHRLFLFGDPLDAVVFLQGVLIEKPLHPIANFQMSRYKLSLGQEAEALQYIDHALSQNADFILFWRQKLLILSKLNDVDLLFSTHRQASERFPDNFGIQRNYLDFLYLSGMHDEALAQCRKMSRRFGYGEDIAFTQVAIFQRSALHDSVSASYERLVSVYPDSAVYYFLLARHFASLRQYDKAELQYRRVVEHFPGRPAYEYYLCEFYATTGQLQQFEESFAMLLPHPLISVSRKVFLLDTVRSAYGSPPSEGYSKLVNDLSARYESDAAVLWLRARHYMALGQPVVAADAAKRYVLSEPSDYDMQLLLLAALSDANLPDSVLRYAGLALELYPNQSVFYYYEAQSLFALGRYREATGKIDFAILAGGPLIKSYYALAARIYGAVGNVAKATEYERMSQ